MGMVAYFAAVSPATQQALRDNPERLEAYIYPEQGELAACVDVDKAWHAIHYLLERQSDQKDDPLKQVVFGGAEIGSDLGYGPARLLAPGQVQQIAAALVAVSLEAFRSKYDPTAMRKAEIYPDIIWERERDEALDYVLAYFDKLVQFYRDTAARGDGAILWLA